MKRVITVILALVLVMGALILPAQAEDSDILGVWELISGSSNGVTIDIKAMGLTMELEFRSNGSYYATIGYDGESQTNVSRFTADGGLLTVTGDDGSSAYYTYEIYGDEMELGFLQNGKVAAEYVFIRTYAPEAPAPAVSSSGSIVGHWLATSRTANGVTADLTMYKDLLSIEFVFGADGSLEIVSTANGTTSSQKGSYAISGDAMLLTFDGSVSDSEYVLNGNSLSITETTDAGVTSFTFVKLGEEESDGLIGLWSVETIAGGTAVMVLRDVGMYMSFEFMDDGVCVIKSSSQTGDTTTQAIYSVSDGVITVNVDGTVNECPYALDGDEMHMELAGNDLTLKRQLGAAAASSQLIGTWTVLQTVYDGNVEDLPEGLSTELIFGADGVFTINSRTDDYTYSQCFDYTVDGGMIILTEDGYSIEAEYEIDDDVLYFTIEGETYVALMQ